MPVVLWISVTQHCPNSARKLILISMETRTADLAEIHHAPMIIYDQQTVPTISKEMTADLPGLVRNMHREGQLMNNPTYVGIFRSNRRDD